MKTLVVYYSHMEGNTEFIANMIKKQLNADIAKIMPVKRLPKKGFWLYFKGGMQALMRMKPKLKPLSKNPEEYDLIIIGTPVWAGNITPYVRSFISQTNFKNKKVAFFTHFVADEKNAPLELKNLLKEAKIIGKASFRNALENKSSTQKQVTEWLKKIQK